MIGLPVRGEATRSDRSNTDRLEAPGGILHLVAIAGGFHHKIH